MVDFDHIKTKFVDILSINCVDTYKTYTITYSYIDFLILASKMQH